MSLADAAATDTGWLARWREATAKQSLTVLRRRAINMRELLNQPSANRDWIIVSPIQPQSGVVVYAVPTKAAEIIRIVCARHDLPQEIVCSNARRQDIVAARFEVFYLIRAVLGRSLPEIGRAVGRRDHTTVLNGIRQFQARHHLPPPHEAPYDLVCKLLFQGVGGYVK